MEKELKFPESSFIKPPYKVEGPPKEARESFYELAKDRIKYLNSEEFKKWQTEVREKPNFLTAGSGIMVRAKDIYKGRDNVDKWIRNLEIVIDKDRFNINGKDYSDVIPSILEHEIYELWLDAKKGVGPELSRKKKHLLARRRQYLLAEQQGLGDKLFERDMIIYPQGREEYEYALQAAKKQLGHLKKKGVGGKK